MQFFEQNNKKKSGTSPCNFLNKISKKSEEDSHCFIEQKIINKSRGWSMYFL